MRETDADDPRRRLRRENGALMLFILSCPRGIKSGKAGKMIHYAYFPQEAGSIEGCVDWKYYKNQILESLEIKASCHVADIVRKRLIGNIPS
jgi:hypothetical protein